MLGELATRPVIPGMRPFEYSLHGACTLCGFQLESELEPRHFSFNTHVGACERCDGLGKTVQCEPDLLLVPLLNIIFYVIVTVDLAKSFGKGVGFAIGLILLSPIFILILGFGAAEYRGPAAAQ